MDELIKELRAWLSIRPEINHRTHLRKEFEEILSRHKAKDKAVEPLAVLADRKGLTLSWAGKRSEGIWEIWFNNFPETDYVGYTYAAAEAKARQFLEGLEDVREEK